MWQVLLTVALVIAALVYIIRSLTRSAKGQCECGTGTCSLARDRKDTSLPCQGSVQAISAESLEESARNLAGKGGHPADESSSA
jgi:hypothetical protein